MKFLALIVFALSLTAPAQAGYYHVVEVCTSMSPTPDHNYKVIIDARYLSRVDTVNQFETTAILTEESSENSHELGSYDVEYKAPQRGIAGSHGAYVGEDFELSFPLVPGRDGASIAHLSATQNKTSSPAEIEVQVDDTLLCHGDL